MAGRGSVGQPVPVRPPRPGAAQGWATTEGEEGLLGGGRGWAVAHELNTIALIAHLKSDCVQCAGVYIYVNSL